MVVGDIRQCPLVVSPDFEHDGTTTVDEWAEGLSEDQEFGDLSPKFGNMASDGFASIDMFDLRRPRQWHCE